MPSPNTKISMIYFEKALSLRKLLIGGPNFVYNVLLGKNCSTFFYDKPLALLNFRTKPYAALTLEYSLFRLIFSDFESVPSASVFRFGNLVVNKFRCNLSCFQKSESKYLESRYFFALVHTQSLQVILLCLD